MGCRARLLQNSGNNLGLGARAEISGVTKLVDHKQFTLSSSIPFGLVASCWPVLPGVWSESNLAEVLILINWRYARIGEQNLAGTAGVCVESGDSTLFGCCNPFHGNVDEGAQTLRTCIGVL